MDLPRGFTSADCEPFKEGHDRFTMGRLSTVHGVLDGRMSDEPIDGGEPQLPFRKALEPGVTGIGRQVKVKPPDGGKRASVALGLHDDELDSAFLIPVAVLREQSGAESPPTPLRTPNPELLMGDSERRTAQPNLACGFADDLAGFVGDHPQVDRSARPIWQPQIATQDLSDHLSRLCDLGADIPELEVKPPESEAEIAFQQSVADRSDSVVLIDHWQSDPRARHGRPGVLIAGLSHWDAPVN
jgi:hypothetical protein